MPVGKTAPAAASVAVCITAKGYVDVPARQGFRVASLRECIRILPRRAPNLRDRTAMSNAPAAAFAESVQPATNLCDRKHKLTPPKTIAGRIGLRLQDVLESFIARVSVHGDPAIYDVKTFPWAT